MKNKSFSIGEEIKAGWTKFKEQPLTWIFSILLVLAILGTHPILNNWLLTGDWHFNDISDQQFEHINQKTKIIFALVFLGYVLIKFGLTLGLINMGIRAADGLKVNILHLFSRFHRVFQYAIASILYFLIILVGIILLIFPAAIWGSKYALYGYFIADKGIGPLKALEKSSEATYGSKWDVFGFLLVNLLLFSVAVTTIIGLFIFYPLLIIAWGYIYRKLSTPSESQEVIRTTTIVTPQPVLPKVENKILE